MKELSDFDEVEVPPLEKGSLSYVATHEQYILSVFTAEKHDYIRVTDVVERTSMKKVRSSSSQLLVNSSCSRSLSALDFNSFGISKI